MTHKRNILMRIFCRSGWALLNLGRCWRDCRSLRTPAVAFILLLTIAPVISGCNDGNDSGSAPPAAPAVVGDKPSRWRSKDSSVTVAVPDEDADRELAAAIAQARASAGEARQRWAAAAPQDRSRWSVKWAAPTVDGRVEHVWVQPANWSGFRIEGLLASQPINELACGKTLGELVSFPSDELSDWIHDTTVNESPPSSGARTFEGGFTVKLLEQRYGRPPSADARK